MNKGLNVKDRGPCGSRQVDSCSWRAEKPKDSCSLVCNYEKAGAPEGVELPTL